MSLTHSEVQTSIKHWLVELGYKPVNSGKFPSHPDIFLLSPDNVICSYEIKPEISSHGEIRRGIMQAIESLLLGSRSYLVVCDKYLPELDLFLFHLPKFGIITYRPGNGTQPVVIREPELITNPLDSELFKEVIKSSHPASDMVNKPISRKRRGTAVRVKGYTMRRKGKTVRVKGYSRKRPKK